MNITQAAQNYLNKMVSDVQGMKILLLDANTTSIISSFSTQSYLLSKDVFLVDRIDNTGRPKMQYMKCICFLRPTPESIAHVMDELKSPKYGEYYLYFSNVVKKSQIEQMAETDEYEVVKEVQECFCDFQTVNEKLFTLDMDPVEWPIHRGSLNEWDPNTLQRTMEGLAAVCLSLKKRPVIRYAAFSGQAKRLSHELANFARQENSLFDGRGVSNVLVLILDRRSDPVTPLLMQWTYQAMVHELLGNNNGLVDLSHVEGVRDDMHQVVLVPQEDSFYAENLYSNFGDLGFAIKNYLAEYQKKTPNKAAMDSIADMKKFVDEYPEVRKLAGNVSKHVTLTSELSRLVEVFKLLEVSEVEQNLACTDRDQSEAVGNLLRDPQVSNDSKLKLVLLYALRNERSPHVASFVQLLTVAGVSPLKVGLVERIVKYWRENVSSSSASGSGITADSFLDARVISLGKSVFRGLKGVENVYTQHSPPLNAVLENLMRGKLKESQYPFIEGNGASQGFPEGSRVHEIIVFMVGGCTFEEERFVHQLMAASPGLKIILGGNMVHNSQRVNFFDTAEVYANGACETEMGAAFKRLGCRRSDLVVSTKLFWGGKGPNDRGLSRKHIVEGLDASLKRLDMDYVDIIFAHRPDPDTPIEETVRAFNHVINQGKAFYWGTSEWSAQQITEAHAVAQRLNLVGPLCEQPQYNILHRDRMEKEYKPLFDNFGMGTTIWSPLASGVLTGKYNDPGNIPKDSRFALTGNVLMERMRNNLSTEEGAAKIAKVKKLQYIAKGLDVTCAQLALAWAASNKDVSTIITGASRPAQVIENIKSLAVIPKITEAITKEIEEALDNKPDQEVNFRAL